MHEYTFSFFVFFSFFFHFNFDIKYSFWVMHAWDVQRTCTHLQDYYIAHTQIANWKMPNKQPCHFSWQQHNVIFASLFLFLRPSAWISSINARTMYRHIQNDIACKCKRTNGTERSTTALYTIAIAYIFKMLRGACFGWIVVKRFPDVVRTNSFFCLRSSSNRMIILKRKTHLANNMSSRSFSLSLSLGIFFSQMH